MDRVEPDSADFSVLVSNVSLKMNTLFGSTVDAHGYFCRPLIFASLLHTHSDNNSSTVDTTYWCEVNMLPTEIQEQERYIYKVGIIHVVRGTNIYITYRPLHAFSR